MTEETYERVMNHLNFLNGGVVPSSINVDFERGAIMDVETVPKYKQIRLFFLLVEKHIYKRVEGNGLAPLHVNDQVFSTIIRMVCALPFVSVADNERC